MKVTDKEYYMDDLLLSKLDLMIKRMMGTDDNILLIDGDEGQGKTEFACGICYYISYQTKRPYRVDNIFFDLDKAIEFTAKTKEQIVHIDEGALGLLSTGWRSKNQQKFLQLVMTARKKKHFIVICIPKFYKLSRYVVEERIIGLIHVYSRQNLYKGRFCYYTKRKKDMLIESWKRKNIKAYNRLYSFRGSFVKVMYKIFTEEQLEEYEKKKDEGIESILLEDKETDTPQKVKMMTTKEIYKNIMNSGLKLTQKQLEPLLGVSTRTIQNYARDLRNETELST